ncbi:hypothetical protein IW152_001956 [Coemansia sp. BCRC 34962]|nr:hypothetical protein IW152_001956 [Coemansia sp. BCRC 34962]
MSELLQPCCLSSRDTALDAVDKCKDINTSQPGEGGVTADLALRLQRRNERAVQFLVSIASSHVVDRGPQTVVGTNRRYDARFDIDPQRVLDLCPAGLSVWSEGHSGSHFTGSGVTADARPGHVGFTAQAGVGRRATALCSNGGGAVLCSNDTSDERPPDMGYSGIRNQHHQTEFVPMKSSTLPMVFASIKPFRGPGEDKHRGGMSGSGTNDKDQAIRLGASKADQSFAHLLYSLRTLESEAEHDSGVLAGQTYQPNRLDDPGLHKGLQRTVLGLTGYMGTIFEYTRPDDLRQELNDHFRETHPELCAVGLTLDQIRRLRAHMLRVTREQDLELSTAAIAWVYFEKLIWKGYVAKDNRKLVAALLWIQ